MTKQKSPDKNLQNVAKDLDTECGEQPQCAANPTAGQ